MHEIESGDVVAMVDSASAYLLAEINRNLGKISLSPFVGVATIIVAWVMSSRISPVITLPVGFLAFVVARLFDTHRKTTVLMYAFDEPQEAAFKNVHDAFSKMASAGGIWHIEREGHVVAQDRKYHAGATTLLGRKRIRLSFAPPRFIKTNLPVPAIPLGKQTLHFLPDAILVTEGRKVGAVGYGLLSCAVQSNNFIETGGVPSDAIIVGSTWRYVNKSGGPDRRFKDNRSIPIAKYDEIHFTSSTGLNELVQISNPGVCAGVASSLGNLASATTVR